MLKQGNVLTEEQYSGAPIERAHLHRGFKAVKTPIKWIRFFRACVLQYEVAEKKKNRKIKIYSIIFFIPVLLMVYLGFAEIFHPALAISIGIACVIALTVIASNIRGDFNENYTDGYDFFARYFSAFFTLIEEELAPESRINLSVNVKETRNEEFFLKKEKYHSDASNFISGKHIFYEKEISSGSCNFKDGSSIAFKFIERLRDREVNKYGSSGKRKWKNKFKSTYPFILKMKIPKSRYTLNPEVANSKLEIFNEPDYHVFKVSRKFSVRAEQPESYEPYDLQSIMRFESDYFALELINLINVCYSAVKPKS